MTKLRGLLGILTMAVGFAFYTVPGLNPGGAGVSGLLIVLVFLALLPPSMNAYTLALLGMIGTFGPAITRVEYSFDPATSTTAMCGLFFLLGGLLIGYTLPVRFKPSANQEVRLPALKWIIFAYAICGAGGVLFVIKRMDLRPEQLIGIHGDWGFLLGDLGPLYWASGTLLSASVLLCLLVATRLAPAKRSARVLATGWAVFVIATSLPRSGRSGTLVFVFVWIGLRWMRGRQRLSAKYVVAGSAGAAILIGLLVVMSSIRARPGEIPTADEIVRVRDPADLLSQNTYDYFFAVDSFEQPEQRLNGSSILAVLLQLAPRSLWPGKPYPFGYTLGLMEGLPPGKSGAPGGTYAGEMFANFGMPGVVVGSLLLGVWCQRIDLLGSTTKDPLKLLLYYLAVWYTAIVMRGDLASSLLPLATLSATVLACRLQRIRRRRSSAYVAAEPSRCGARTASRCLQITPGMG